MNFKQFLQEKKENHAVLAFGRMNPPTTGHEVLVKKVHDVAKEVGGSHHVVLSHSQDKAKNPLSAEQKVKHAKRFFPNTNISTSDKEHPNFLSQAAKLHKQGVTHLHMVAGSDRVPEYHKILHKYNGTHEGALFNFKHIQVHSAGERDPDAEGTAGMSASKMRGHAASGNYNEFRKGIPAHVKDTHAKELYNDVRKNMGVKEDVDEEFEELLTEGVHDKAIFKAVFLAGGPGSGKDYVLHNTLSGHGLTEINSDNLFEIMMDKKGLNKKMPSSEEEARDLIRGRAKDVTELRQHLALKGRNGLIINGTGDNPEKIAKIKQKLEELGYDTHMLVVNTNNEVSQKRNIERGERGGRTVPENIRSEKWNKVQVARPQLAKLFGSNYTEFENSEDLRTAHPEVVKAKKDEMANLFKKIKSFVDAPPKNRQAKNWVAGELARKDTSTIPKNGTQQLAPANSGAAEEAKKLGLQYYGFGRYGKNGKITHHSVHDKLVQDPTHAEHEKVLAKQDKISLASSSGSGSGSTVKENPAIKNRIVAAKETSPLKKLTGAEKKAKGVNEEFEDFLSEAVTVTVSGDTPEEVSKTLRLLKSNDVEDVKEEDEIEHTSFSNGDALTLLTLGKGLIRETTDVKLKNTSMSPEQIAKKHGAPLGQIKKQLEMGKKIEHEHTKNDEVAYDIAKNHVAEVPNYYTKLKTVVEETQVKYIMSMGKPRVYHLRQTAAKDAHTKNGVVVKVQNGYMVKLKENYDVEEDMEVVEHTNTETGTRSKITLADMANKRSDTRTGSSGSAIRAGADSGTYTEESYKENKTKKYFSEAKKNFQKINEIDAGTEVGMSMNGYAKEKLNKNGKVSMAELTGDETTASIGDQKENELKKVGISLTTFKKKNYL